MYAEIVFATRAVKGGKATTLLDKKCDTTLYFLCPVHSKYACYLLQEAVSIGRSFILAPSLLRRMDG